jgi:hypothetical protein
MNNLSNIAHYRLLRQGIAAPKFEQPAQIIAWLGAMQAQDYAGTLWAIALRMQQPSQSAIDLAIANRSIVRTWPMRGTLHFVAAADVRWMLKLMTPRIITASGTRQRQLGLDQEVFARSREVLGQALQGGNQLTRPEIYSLLEQANISAAGQRGIHIIGRLAQEAFLCFGVIKGKQPTFVLLDEWLPPATTKVLTYEESLAELAQRYFSSHGPATLQDLVWWSGLKVSEVRTGLEMVKTQFTQITDVGNGQTYYWLPPTTEQESESKNEKIPKQVHDVHLLPGFDEYLLGYRDRQAALDPIHSQKVVPGGNGMFMPTIVSDGRIVGIWKRTLAKSKANKQKDALPITPDFFTELDSTQLSSLEVAANRYTDFMQNNFAEVSDM